MELFPTTQAEILDPTGTPMQVIPHGMQIVIERSDSKMFAWRLAYLTGRMPKEVKQHQGERAKYWMEFLSGKIPDIGALRYFRLFGILTPSNRLVLTGWNGNGLIRANALVAMDQGRPEVDSAIGRALSPLFHPTFLTYTRVQALTPEGYERIWKTRPQPAQGILYHTSAGPVYRQLQYSVPAILYAHAYDVFTAHAWDRVTNRPVEFGKFTANASLARTIKAQQPILDHEGTPTYISMVSYCLGFNNSGSPVPKNLCFGYPLAPETPIVPISEIVRSDIPPFIAQQGPKLVVEELV